MSKLNLGCGRTTLDKPWINVDMVAFPGVDIVGDVSNPATFTQLADDSIEEMMMMHLLEHIANPLPMLEVLWRVAKNNCILNIAVPHGAHDMAFADPQHVRQYFPSSFQFFGQPAYKRADYGYKGDWRADRIMMKLEEDVPKHIPDRELSILAQTNRNIISEMRVVLSAVKPARDVWESASYNPPVYIVRTK